MSKHDPERLAHWRELIDQQVQSGLSIQSFCKQRRIHTSGFHRWKSIIAQLESQSAPLPKPQNQDKPLSATFVPLRVVPDPLVEFVLPNGITLQLPLLAHAEQITQIVQAVTSC